MKEWSWRIGSRLIYEKNIRMAIVFCVPVFIGRIFILVFSREISYEEPMAVFYIFRGMVSDLVPTFLTGYLLSFIPGKKTVWAFWIFTCVLSAANAEHVLVNLGNIDFRYALLGADREFFGGSVFSLRVILLMGANLGLSWLLVRYGSGLADRIRHSLTAGQDALAGIRKPVPVFTAGFLGLLILPMNYSVFPCVQMGLVEENVRKTWYNLYADLAHPVRQLPDDMRSRLFGKDLTAPFYLKPPEKPTDILLVMLESIGEQTIESGMMPRLKKTAERNIYIPRYMISQKQTNRGLYNVLCGDYPNLVSSRAKLDMIARKGRKCLPELLKGNGYQTVFMQSAPLGFMAKDRDMPEAGFEEVLGEKSFRVVSGKTAWGVDDRTLYAGAMDKIKAETERGQRLFLTLLTVGTHHPYRPTEGAPSNYAVAVKYADDALAGFLEELSASGLDREMMVVITADESHGPLDGGSIPLIGRNHSFMVIIPPGGKVKKLHGDLFAASDFMLSVADYLRLPTGEMTGRSIFRDYNREDRTLVFGHTYAGVFYLLDGHDLNVCSYDYYCSHYHFNGKFFGSNDFVKTSAIRTPDIMQAIVQYNDWK